MKQKRDRETHPVESHFAKKAFVTEPLFKELFRLLAMEALFAIGTHRTSSTQCLRGLRRCLVGLSLACFVCSSLAVNLHVHD